MHLNGEELFLRAFVDTPIVISPCFFYSIYRVTEFEIFQFDSYMYQPKLGLFSQRFFVFLCFFFCINLIFLLSVAIERFSLDCRKGLVLVLVLVLLRPLVG